MVNNQEAVVQIAGKHLGKVGGEGYKDTYDPSLLVKIPRYLNREAYGIDDNNLPFVGVDVWNAYEVSAITRKGLPVSGMLKIVYSADSKYHVESKSIKLYLNSLNMTKMGGNTKECISLIEENVSKDLTELLETSVMCKFFTSTPSYTFNMTEEYVDVGELVDLDQIEFNSYYSDSSQLKKCAIPGLDVIRIKSNLLRSNCRVTNQPDWGDMLIYLKASEGNVPDLESIVKYIVSHRQVSHFHEEICEMVYTHLMAAYSPEELMVTCLYSRRGGIDINPLRASNLGLIPIGFASPTTMLLKTLKQ